MNLCEIPHLFLHPDRTYIFRKAKGCKKCEAYNNCQSESEEPRGDGRDRLAKYLHRRWSGDDSDPCWACYSEADQILALTSPPRTEGMRDQAMFMLEGHDKGYVSNEWWEDLRLALTALAQTEGIVCPFCKEDDFDLVGLRNHIMSGHCEPFESTPTIEQERASRAEHPPQQGKGPSIYAKDPPQQGEWMCVDCGKRGTGPKHEHICQREGRCRHGVLAGKKCWYCGVVPQQGVKLVMCTCGNITGATFTDNPACPFHHPKPQQGETPKEK
jgi:hypothetical protein